MINVSNQASLYCKISESPIPTVNGFYIVCYASATTTGNAIVHFSFIAEANITLFKILYYSDICSC